MVHETTNDDLAALGEERLPIIQDQLIQEEQIINETYSASNNNEYQSAQLEPNILHIFYDN